MAIKMINPPSAKFNTPRLMESEEIRHSSWLELFLDLAYVSIIAQLIMYLLHFQSFREYIFFILLLIPVLWSWVGHTLFSTRFNSDDVYHKALTMTQMLGVGIMAIGIEEIGRGNSQLFAIGYIICRTVLLGLYARIDRFLPAARGTTSLFLRAFGVSVIIWVISLFLPGLWMYVAWSIGIAIELISPWLGTSKLNQTPVNRFHLPERFGLFSMIVLSEMFLGMVDAIAQDGRDLNVIILALFVFLLLISVWILYYDYLEKSEVNRNKFRSVGNFVYGHLPIYAGLITLTTGVRNLVDHGHITTFGYWYVPLGLSLYVLGFVFIKNTCYTSVDTLRRAATWIIVSLVSFLIFAFGHVGWSDSISLIAVIVLFCCAVVYERFIMD